MSGAGRYTLAWARWAIDRLNADEDAASAAEGWSGDFGLVVTDLEGGVGFYLGAPVEGRLPAPEAMTPVALEARTPAYFASADAETWSALIDGGLDPIAAVVQKRLVVRGDLTPVVARLNYRGLAERWLDGLRRGE